MHINSRGWFSIRIGLVASMLMSWGASAFGVTLPFTEDFNADAADWRDAASTTLTWVSSGGPDGGAYVSGTFNFASSAQDDTPAIARAQDEWNSSGNAFVGDYLFPRANQFSVWVRHDTPVPLNYFVRFAGPNNFPGAIALQFAPVPPNTWTKIDLPIYFGSQNIISYEGSDHESVFGNVGHVQIGFTVPAALAGVNQSYTFDIDKASIGTNNVPAASEWGLATLTLLMLSAGTVALRRKASPHVM